MRIRIIHRLGTAHELKFDDEDADKMADKRIYIVIDTYGNKQGRIYDPVYKKMLSIEKFLFGFSQSEHIDGDKLNFCRNNVMPRKNFYNGRIGRSGARHVLLMPNGTYAVYIKAVSYGTFYNIEDAIAARDEALMEINKITEIQSAYIKALRRGTANDLKAAINARNKALCLTTKNI